MMREIEFIEYSGVGNGGTRERGTIADLLETIPYLLVFDVIPSLQILNEVLQRGYEEAGMSGRCEWAPFTIDGEEWQDVRRQLEDRGYEYEAPADWVKNYQDWRVWLMERKTGVPAQEHQRLNKRYDDLSAAIAKAVAEGNDDVAMELDGERTRVADALKELILKHRRE